MENNETFENRIDLSPLKEGVDKIKTEIGKVIVGQDEMVELIISAILSDGHILLEGVPGVAKTLAARMVAKVVDVGFSRIQFTPDLMPSDIIGTSVFNMKNTEFEFRAGPIFSNIILIDEINRAPAKTQAALFEVMEERQVTVDGDTMKMDEPYLVIATQNPIEQEGTYRLPEAQLDRFLYKINVDYPTEAQEVDILHSHHSGQISKGMENIKKVLKPKAINEFRKLVKQVYVEEPLIKYIAAFVQDTRRDESLFLGASPRASIAILNGAKSIAAINGRDFVTPEDIQQVAYPALRHRIILSPEREMEGILADEIIEQTLKRVEVPR